MNIFKFLIAAILINLVSTSLLWADETATTDAASRVTVTATETVTPSGTVLQNIRANGLPVIAIYAKEGSLYHNKPEYLALIYKRADLVCKSYYKDSSLVNTDVRAERTKKDALVFDLISGSSMTAKPFYDFMVDVTNKNILSVKCAAPK